MNPSSSEIDSVLRSFERQMCGGRPMMLAGDHQREIQDRAFEMLRERFEKSERRCVDLSGSLFRAEREASKLRTILVLGSVYLTVTIGLVALVAYWALNG